MSSPTRSDARPLPKPGLVAVPVDGETVVYDPDLDVLHRLDGPASAVWSRLDGRATVDAVASRLAADLGAPAETVRSDVAALTGTLWRKGLLDGSPPDSTGPMQDEVPLRRAPSAEPRSLSPEVRRSDPQLPEARRTESPPSGAVHRTGRYRALEHAFEVATDDAAVRDYLAEVLADLVAADEGATAALYELVHHPSGPAWVVRCDGEVVLVTDWLDRALYALLWHINAETVRRSAARYPLVHAAAAAHREVAVLLPAPPDAGKTTTVAGLVRAGFDYLTDEAVAIDPDTLHALPYPKAMSVNRGSWEVLADLRPPHAGRVAGQWQLPARSIRTDAVAVPAPVRYVVLPRYSPGVTTSLEPLSPAEVLVQLADSAFHFQDAPRRNLEVLARVLEDADCHRLVHGDLDEAVQLVRELVRA